ncbi:hypothetical protein P6U16_08835 [Rhizobium sp. 32-5/1]|uniref:hypothetical protein n=1 Tax=Rhizobium sp. 32-5/1 TaxID=3019602 RepID=UPI00240E5A14|nr:hypothetical protein [Rhizobium sp. 32-5/1]WEZ84658.1 hypothetical protein P6U16_08835 [Rhizobium sp. 32-5/1]
MRWRTGGIVYALLLAGQTIAASALFWIVFPVFHEIVTNLGERQELPPSQQLSALGSAAFLHLCYWTRLTWVPVVAPFHSVFLGHVCAFASRVSFFFGGALFSVLFFRHLPALDVMPPCRGRLSRLSRSSPYCLVSTAIRVNSIGWRWRSRSQFLAQRPSNDRSVR